MRRNHFKEMYDNLDRYDYHTFYGKHYRVLVHKYHKSGYSVTVVRRKGFGRIDTVRVPEGASLIVLNCVVIDMVKKHLGKHLEVE